MNGLGFRDWPDRMVLKPGVPWPLWIEFKRPGEEQTKSQRLLAERLRAFGHSVRVCHSREDAAEAYEEHR